MSGGTGPYNVVWPFDGSSGLCLSNIPSNTYIVNATDDNGCPAQATVTVSDLSGPSASITSQTNVTCFGGSDGAATALITGGLAPYNYQWDANAANQTTPTASNLVQGTYTLTITDQNGCIASTSVTITQPADFVVQGLTTNPTCFGDTDGQIAVTLTGGTAPYTYDWNDPANQTTPTASGLGDGSYTVVITDDVGCNTFAQYNLFDPLQFVAFANNTPLLCNSVCDGTATATFNNNNGAVSYLWNDGNSQTTATASGLCAGNYEVTMTDNAGCIATATTTITEPTTLSGTIDLVGDVTCNGLCNGFANANITGGTAPYTFSWSDGSTNPTAINLCVGNYSVDVTDANGCQITLNATITQPTAMNGNMTNVNVSCYGLQNGQATFSVGGGVAPYTYQWDDLNFQTTAVASNLFAGNYNVTVTDDNGCVLTENIVITQPNQIAANVNVTNSNCGQNNGNVCVNISGGVLPYQFVWNDPNQQTSACAVNMLAGTYTVTVTDNNNCVFDTIVNINDILGPTVTFNDLTDPSCNGLTDGEINMTVTGGTLPYATYAWDNNGNNIANNTASLTNIGNGCYTLTVIDDAGCAASNTQCLFEPNALNSAITNSQNVSCNLACDGNATVSSAGGTLPHTIAWTNGANTNFNGNLCAGTYQVTITDDNGCQSNASVTITEPDPLVTSVLTEIDVTCFGLTNGQASISVAGGTAPYLHTWNPLVSSSTITTGLAAGGYNIQTVDANGCITNIGVTINSPSELTGTMTVQDATCGDCNGEVTYIPAGGTAPYTYLWDNGQTAITATGVCAGNFGGTVIDANGCTYNTLENVVNIAGPVISTVGFVSPSCNGLSNGSATPDFGGGTAPFNYAWSNGQTSQTAVGINAGNYCVTITDANSCVTTSCVNVTQPNQLVSIPDGSTTICFGQETQIWASGAGGTIPYTINWTGANTAGFTGQGPILVSPEFSQEFCFRVEDGNGCLSDISCIPITVTPALQVTLPADLFICEGDNYLISGTYSGGSGDPYQYQWYQNNYPGPAIGAGPTLDVSPTGVTSYIVELTDGCSTPAFDTIQISLNPNPSAFLNVVNPNECAPGTINFIANSDIGTTFNWDFQCDGTEDLSSANTTASFTYNDPGVYDVCLEVISDEGCVTLVSEIDGVEIYSNPIANFTANPETTTMTNPYVDFTDLSSDAFQWYWDFNGDGNFDDSIQNPSHFYEFPGTYNVGLTIFNAFGCTDYIEIPYTVKPDQNIYVPNAFSPDGDGTNDFFFVGGIGLDVEVFDIYVFNRWGEIIWEGHSPTAQWDGMHKNVPVQTDVYVWQLNTVDVNGSPVKMNGHVTVIR